MFGCESLPGYMYSLVRQSVAYPGLISYSQRSAIRYDTKSYFNVRSKADISQLNLPHATELNKL